MQTSACYLDPNTYFAPALTYSSSVFPICLCAENSPLERHVLHIFVGFICANLQNFILHSIFNPRQLPLQPQNYFCPNLEIRMSRYYCTLDHSFFRWDSSRSIVEHTQLYTLYRFDDCSVVKATKCLW
jgi:hypothetical protein